MKYRIEKEKIVVTPEGDVEDAFCRNTLKLSPYKAKNAEGFFAAIEGVYAIKDEAIGAMVGLAFVIGGVVGMIIKHYFF